MVWVGCFFSNQFRTGCPLLLIPGANPDVPPFTHASASSWPLCRGVSSSPVSFQPTRSPLHLVKICITLQLDNSCRVIKYYLASMSYILAMSFLSLLFFPPIWLCSKWQIFFLLNLLFENLFSIHNWTGLKVPIHFTRNVSPASLPHDPSDISCPFLPVLDAPVCLRHFLH